MNLTAADCQLVGLNLIGTTAQNAVDLSAAAHRTAFRRCKFDLATPAVNIATQGVALLGAAEDVLIEDCYVISDGAQGNWLDMTGSLRSQVQRCRAICTLGSWASAILCGAATSGLLIEECDFECYGTAITAGVNGTGATIARGVSVRYCDFGNLVTVPVDNFDAAEAEINECYKCGVGATDGGTKVVAIT
jgi:hypothetical protein